MFMFMHASFIDHSKRSTELTGIASRQKLCIQHNRFVASNNNNNFVHIYICEIDRKVARALVLIVILLSVCRHRFQNTDLQLPTYLVSLIACRCADIHTLYARWQRQQTGGLWKWMAKSCNDDNVCCV